MDAINHAMVRIRGSYALAVMFQDYPGGDLRGPKGQPHDHRCGGRRVVYLASDVPAILKYTRSVYYIGNLEMCQTAEGESDLLQP